MAGGKETPRQKMIGMMYLVLTALLAMNVSKEVINAFVTIDDGQLKTLSAVDQKLSTQYDALDKNATESEEKYGQANRDAIKIKKAADELILHIDKIKGKTFAVTMIGGPEAPLEAAYDVKTRQFLISLDSVKVTKGVDNYDINTNIMVQDVKNKKVDDDPDGNNYTAVVLRDKLIAYRELVVAELDKLKAPTLSNNVKKTFDFPTDEEAIEAAPMGKKAGAEGWITTNFYHVPLAASTAILTTLQSNIRSAQSDVVDQLYKEVEGESFKFNRLKSAVIPQATTITQGASYNASVFLAAYDDQNQPEIRLGAPGAKWDSIKGDLIGESVVLDIDPITNMGIVDLPSGGLGTQQRDGMIIFRPVGGTEIKTGFTLDYQVVAPTLVVSPTKMNVFYKGIPNPVNVSIPGFTADQITPSISNGSISKGSDGYIVNVSSGNTANVNCSATLPDGSSKSYGPVEFRVKRIPDPVPSFAGKKPTDNTVKKSDMTNSQGLRAVMENFDFDVKVSVRSFDMVFVKDGQVITKKSSSNRVSSEMQANMKKVRAGEKIYFENIQVTMPDGTTRKVANIILKVV